MDVDDSRDSTIVQHMFCLRVVEGPDAGQLLPLPPGEPQLLGRSSESLPLTDGAVSRRHAELTPDGEQWFVRDLDSTGGTRLNGAVVTGRQGLHEGDELRCGRTRLIVEIADGPLGGPGRRTAPTASTCFDVPDDADAPAVLRETLAALAAALDGRQVNIDGLPKHLGTALDRLGQSRQGMERRAQLAAMGEGVASVSHAIKNILQGLQGGAGAVSMALQRDDLEMARKAWPIMSRNLDRISDLALNMLAFSRPRPSHRRLHSLTAVVAEVTELLEEPFAHRKVKLVNDLPGDLPPIPLDAAAMHQALLNLLLNALQAAPARSGTVTIQAGLDDGHAWIAVSDNGPGVPEAWREEIFEPFASTRGQRGTGLGLPVTRRIAQQHGGSIAVTQSAGGGATFTLRLSLDLPGQDSDKTDAPLGEPPVPDPRFD
jgi:signal transduction histidine kinase